LVFLSKGKYSSHFLLSDRFYCISAPRESSTRHYDPDRLSAFLRQCAHRCLVYLGDINRYLIEFGADVNLKISQRYYYEAISVDPTNGAPYNQLASMAGGANHGLEAAFFYLRGLVCGGKQFEGVEANLKSLLDRNGRVFAKYDEQSDLPELSASRDGIHQIVSRFLERFRYMCPLLFSCVFPS
jgi:hypothetical protein